VPEIIEKNPNVLGGQPVIKGTRIPVARVVALYIQGYKVRDFKRDYPYLNITKTDIATILSYYKSLAEK